MYKGVTPTEYMRGRRKQFKEAGLCAYCGRPAQPGRTLCQACAIYEAKRSTLRIAKRKADGLCTKCGKRPPEAGVKTCAECRERNKQNCRRWYERQKEETAWRR